MSQLTEAEIAREARRIFRKLDAPGAHLRPDGAEHWRVASRAETANGIKVAAPLVEAFAHRGWITRAGARARLTCSAMRAWAGFSARKPK